MEIFFIVSFSLLTCVRAQYYYNQAQYPYSIYNFRPAYPQNHPLLHQNIQRNQGSIRGNLLSGDTSTLPLGSQITISLADVSLQDVASRPLNTVILYGAYRFPIAFEIPYSFTQVQINNNFHQYAIRARIEKDGQLLYVNDQYTPVKLIPKPINPINVFMKKIATLPGNGGIYTTRAPVVNNPYICLQTPDIGPCKASIEQYYFNAQLGSCQIFFWGGCGGNQNRFDNLSECQRTCAFYQQRMASNNVKQRWIS